MTFIASRARCSNASSMNETEPSAAGAVVMPSPVHRNPRLSVYSIKRGVAVVGRMNNEWCRLSSRKIAVRSTDVNSRCHFGRGADTVTCDADCRVSALGGHGRAQTSDDFLPLSHSSSVRSERGLATRKRANEHSRLQYVG